jgi:1-acyl-sn-glycerol-3-phosphate acyltransferase
MRIVLRSLIFALALLGLLFPFMGVMALLFFVPMAYRYRLAVWWARYVIMPAVRLAAGIRCRVQGRENLPAEPCVILSKHQSAWETIAFLDLFPPITYVLKRELLWIPFFGWGLARMPIVSINRGAGKDALRQVVDQGTQRLAEGYSVVVFPEGTRAPVGCQKRYKIGGASLAVAAGVAVVPVAHNAGEFWRKNAFLKHPGEVVVSIGPAILTAGKTPEQVMAETETWIEAEMRRLFPHHYLRGEGALPYSLEAR